MRHEPKASHRAALHLHLRRAAVLASAIPASDAEEALRPWRASLRRTDPVVIAALLAEAVTRDAAALLAPTEDEDAVALVSCAIHEIVEWVIHHRRVAELGPDVAPLFAITWAPDRECSIADAIDSRHALLIEELTLSTDGYDPGVAKVA